MKVRKMSFEMLTNELEHDEMKEIMAGSAPITGPGGGGFNPATDPILNWFKTGQWDPASTPPSSFGDAFNYTGTPPATSGKPIPDSVTLTYYSPTDVYFLSVNGYYASTWKDNKDGTKSEIVNSDMPGNVTNPPTIGNNLTLQSSTIDNKGDIIVSYASTAMTSTKFTLSHSSAVNYGFALAQAAAGSDPSSTFLTTLGINSTSNSSGAQAFGQLFGLVNHAPNSFIYNMSQMLEQSQGTIEVQFTKDFNGGATYTFNNISTQQFLGSITI